MAIILPILGIVGLCAIYLILISVLIEMNTLLSWIISLVFIVIVAAMLVDFIKDLIKIKDNKSDYPF